MNSITLKNSFYTFLSAALLILLWKMLSLLIGSEIILPSPESTFRALWNIAGEQSFWPSLGATLKRGAAGFFLSSAAALVVGIAAGENRLVYNLFKPLLTVIKTVPVLSIVLLAIIWFSSENVPVFVCFLVVFPVICANVIEGIRHVDPHLLEMSGIYKVSRLRVVFQIYLPSLIPYLLAGFSTAAGVTWKAVIAAEVLSMPKYAMGTGMQFAQIRLNTAELFAWTICAVLISSITEVSLMSLQYLFPWRRKK